VLQQHRADEVALDLACRFDSRVPRVVAQGRLARTRVSRQRSDPVQAAMSLDRGESRLN
jgi:hypothetical protein